MKNRIRFKCVDLRAGSILLWKSYNWFKKLVYMLRRKKLPYNKIMLVDTDIEYCYSTVLRGIKVYTPIRQYTKVESDRLKRFVGSYDKEPICDWTEIIYIVNAVRPKTFKNAPSVIDDDFLSSNNYYRVIDVDKESKEFYYRIK